MQTSPTELLRHAHNAARLARVADGYPLFQAARSPARSDWIEVIRRANNWIGLSMAWQEMCQPVTTLRDHADGQSSALQKFSSADEALDNVPTALRMKPNETPAEREQRIRSLAISDALGDERVVDDETFQRSIEARMQRRYNDEDGVTGPLSNGEPLLSSVGDSHGHAPDGVNSAAPYTAGGQLRKLPPAARPDDDKEYPISTERAALIVRWIREAPLSVAGSGKKKRPIRKKAANGATTAAAENVNPSMAKLSLGHTNGVKKEVVEEEVD